MNKMFKRILVIVSFSLNAVLVLFLVFSLTGKISSVSFLAMESGGRQYTTGVCLASVPAEDADIVFGPVSFTVKTGEEAALQYSVFVDKRQLNLALQPLYDHEIVSIQQSGYGIIITGRKPGETVLQSFTEKGVLDIARITVLPE